MWKKQHIYRSDKGMGGLNEEKEDRVQLIFTGKVTEKCEQTGRRRWDNALKGPLGATEELGFHLIRRGGHIKASWQGCDVINTALKESESCKDILKAEVQEGTDVEEARRRLLQEPR